MNIKNINIMIDTFIRLDKAPLAEHPDSGFGMNLVRGADDFSGHNCGTAFCIQGWANNIFGKEGTSKALSEIIRADIVWPMLTTPEPINGCNYHYSENREKFTLRAAIRVLQILRDTGKVDWNEAIANPWKPEDETPKPAFDKDAWLNALVGEGLDDVAIPLLEGPKRVEETS